MHVAIAILLVVGFLRAMQVGSIAFTPTALALGPGQSAQVDVVVQGMPDGSPAVQVVILHDSANTVISGESCAGLFQGADMTRATHQLDDWFLCTYPGNTGTATGTSGSIMRFTLTSRTGVPETLEFDATKTLFGLADVVSFEPPAVFGTLAVVLPVPTPTSVPPTPVPTDTPTAVPTDTPVPTPTDTPVPPPTSTPVPPPTSTPVPVPTSAGVATSTPDPGPPHCVPANRCRTPSPVATPTERPSPTLIPPLTPVLTMTPLPPMHCFRGDVINGGVEITRLPNDTCFQN